MKSLIARALTFVSLAVAITSAAASAQAQSVKRLKFDIPFDSTVGKTVLPAGEYTLQVQDAMTTKALILRKADGTVVMSSLNTIPVLSRRSEDRPKLVFNRYGDQYFLAQFWDAGTEYGRQFQKSRVERELANGARTAKADATKNQVTLMARQ